MEEWSSVVTAAVVSNGLNIFSGSLLKKLVLRGRRSVVVVTGERCSSWL